MLSKMEDWANLPDHVVALIFSYLSVAERCRAGAACKHWLQCLETPFLWRNFNCGFFLPGHGQLVKCVEQYSHLISRLTITLNQREVENRKNALSVIDCLTELSDLRLTHLTIQFKGENPLFYGGHEFMTALSKLFSKIGEKKENSLLKYINFSDLQVNFDNEFMNGIARNCPNLEYLNILNKILVCCVSPDCMVLLVDKCRKLKTLHVYHTSLNNEVMKKLSEPNRVPLRRLGIVCRRHEKYGEDIASEAWSNLIHANPDLKVELGFDHTTPLHRVAEIIKPEIPVQELHLATFTRIFDEINTAASYYEHTLEKLVVQTRPCKELNEAILNVAQRCKRLNTLYVYCILDKSVIDKILELHPLMKERGTFILKWELEKEPWTVGKEEGE
ncbi:F-box/LRR-repeat protein 8-like [Biomphalaria glabrata]|uniref:F-box/LRR-repeat protein 8 n=1 Tax=Biomphalaria glabrata TaxID=6526 RepID=A0A9W3AX36_BIOGL|nr:F-box/LRR-repeat protein 8-like [Biomphalaria glabrata]XP_055891783.1 F-box/LRR-repeat protein 8-like [Biomphalaria glabrata]XP_055891784.1 F-box/LRR-repeat protein 8-like [Biomphalaria glabrata]XP_055891785.1 F-box/LRR-repeat protein 8-like [Biomphalaria glabrata]XP_055891786.1 F-box/LRR-repeat protein 8-like [Biomphalaria glabrata]